jgi:hypothetical protein
MPIHSLFFSPVSCKHFLPVNNSDSFLLDALPSKEGNSMGSTQLLYQEFLHPARRAWEELSHQVFTSTGMALVMGG